MLQPCLWHRRDAAIRPRASSPSIDADTSRSCMRHAGWTAGPAIRVLDRTWGRCRWRRGSHFLRRGASGAPRGFGATRCSVDASARPLHGGRCLETGQIWNKTQDQAHFSRPSAHRRWDRTDRWPPREDTSERLEVPGARSCPHDGQRDSLPLGGGAPAASRDIWSSRLQLTPTQPTGPSDPC
jgi:hypothetical protein